MSQNLVSLIFPAVGLLLLAVGAFALYRVRRFVKESLRTRGTVVGLAARRSSNMSGRTFAPVVIFEAQGESCRFTDPLYTSPCRYQVGQQVEVLYHWQDHSRARLASPFRLYFVPGLLALLGVIFAAVGVIVYFSESAGVKR